MYGFRQGGRGGEREWKEGKVRGEWRGRVRKRSERGRCGGEGVGERARGG